MISIKEMHAGDGYRYLLNGAADQELVSGASPVTAYYAEAGNPPGRWLGSGLSGLAHGEGLSAGERVSEQQMERLFRSGLDPLTGEPLGRAFRVMKSRAERVQARVSALPDGIPDTERDAMVSEIEAEERARKTSRPVSGFDITFSPPKSVSVLWGLADQGVREQLYEAHQAALADTLAILERDVARTRIGTDGVAQVETAGVIAAAFDHWDSRAGDPQLHTHVVIANRVQGPDGKWRTLDSRGSMFPATVAMSELYDNLLADHVTSRLGIGWDTRGVSRKSKNTSWEMKVVPDDLIAAFSTRGKEIAAEKDRLVTDYRARHGRSPSDATVLKLRQVATLATRPQKQVRALRDLTSDWAARAATVLGVEPRAWLAERLHDSQETVEPLLRLDDLATDGTVADLARAAYTELATERSTWKVWNVRAAAARAAMPYRMVTAEERDWLIAAVTDEVVGMSVDLTPRERAHTPAVFRRGDGTSMFTRTHGGLFTSTDILDAEQRLLTAGQARDSLTVDSTTVERVLAAPTADGYFLSDDQTDAVRDITSSARQVDVLVGPAGAGKTTTLAALRTAWEAHHGDGTIVGLAPSAAAAEVLADALGIATDNTAKWLHEHAQTAIRDREAAHLAQVLTQIDHGDPAWHSEFTRTGELSDAAAQWVATLTADDAPQTPDRIRRAVTDRLTALTRAADRWRFRAGQLVIVDEASLAGTLAIDKLVTAATTAGAKVLLVGDWAQLASIDAGGAFGMLVRDRGDHLAPELAGIRRFTNAWERKASVALRVGDRTALRAYEQNGRLFDGDTQDMLDAAYHAWITDERDGKTSLLIAGDHATVRELNHRGRGDRVAAGLVDADGAVLHDGALAGRGDRIVTRNNDRRLITGRTGWVKNGDTWDVIAHHGDGSLTVRRTKGRGTITLPAAYVAEHIELAYATTAYRAQGSTVDTAHALISAPTVTREVLYVAMTRAREANHAYVATDTLYDELHQTPDEAERVTARSVLESILRRVGVALSAHETAHAEDERAVSIGQLAAEYDTLHRHAIADRHHALLTTCGLNPDTVEASEHFTTLAAAIRRADAYGLKPDNALSALTAAAPVGDDDDPARVLAARLARWTDHALENTPGARRPTRRMIAGLIPAAKVTDPDIQQALDEREHLIEQRAQELAQRALTSNAPWLQRLGNQPTQDDHAAAWRRCVAIIAAYRERHQIEDTHDPIGTPSTDWTQRHDQRRARQAVDDAQRLAGHSSQSTLENFQQGRDSGMVGPTL